MGSSSVSFLGHMLPRDGLKTDPDKIAAVKNFPQPTTVRDVRAFIGLAGYYRRFVENFAKPLHQLLTTPTKKDRNPRVNWTKQCQESFDYLKSDNTQYNINTMIINKKRFR